MQNICCIFYFNLDVSVLFSSKHFGMFSKLGPCLVLVVFGYVIISRDVRIGYSIVDFAFV